MYRVSHLKRPTDDIPKKKKRWKIKNYQDRPDLYLRGPNIESQYVIKYPFLRLYLNLKKFK